MKNDERLSAFSADELKAMGQRGEDRSDWQRVKDTTEAELVAAIASDSDEAGIAWDWSRARIEPVGKAQTTMRFDRDVLAFFKATGRGWQTRMNAVLRSYMEHHKQ